MLVLSDADGSATSWHDRFLRVCAIARGVMRETMKSCMAAMGGGFVLCRAHWPER
jgi:hypothetical protein